MKTKTRQERTECIMVRLTEEEKKQLFELAAKNDMSASDYFRRVMLPLAKAGVENVSK